MGSVRWHLPKTEKKKEEKKEKEEEERGAGVAGGEGGGRKRKKEKRKIKEMKRKKFKRWCLIALVRQRVGDGFHHSLTTESIPSRLVALRPKLQN